MVSAELWVMCSFSFLASCVTVLNLQWHDGAISNVETQGAERNTFSQLPHAIEGGGSVTIGIISDSFGCLVDSHEDQDERWLPKNIVILRDSCSFQSVDEGRAMAQVIHGIAPNARLIFHSGATGLADFLDAFNNLNDYGCDIIVDDLVFFNQALYTETKVMRRIGEIANKVLVVSAAGNLHGRAIETDFVPFTSNHSLSQIRNSPVWLPRVFATIIPWFQSSKSQQANMILHNFNVASTTIPHQQRHLSAHDEVHSEQTPTIRVRFEPGVYTITMHWTALPDTQEGSNESSDPINDCNPAKDTDLNIFVYNEDMSGILEYSLHQVNPKENFERVDLELSRLTIANIVIAKRFHTTEANSRVRFTVLFPSATGSIDFLQQYIDHSAPSIGGHGLIAHVLTVGAVDGRFQPLKYSSHGGRMVSGCNQSLVQKPDIVGLECAATSFFGEKERAMVGKFRFCGTSAAVARVAGHAAKIIEASSATPQEVRHAIVQTAADIDEEGFDFATGYGLINPAFALNWIRTYTSRA